MNVAMAVTAVAQAAALRGHVDIISRDRIRGWAAGAEPGATVALQILDNGSQVARVLANGYRPDLAAAGIGDGWHGFDLAIPGGLSPLTRHVIQVRREADGTELVGSPRAIEAADNFDAALESAVTQAVAALDGAADRKRVLAFLATQADRLLQQLADADCQRTERLAYARLARRGGQEAALGAGPEQRALVIDERLPVEGRDAGSQAALSHIRALRQLGYAVSLVAADEMAAEASPDLNATLCHAPFYASVEEVLRRQHDGFDLVYLHRASVAGRYLNLVRQLQPRARILYCVADLHHVRLERQAAVEDRPELRAAGRAMRLIECTAAWGADAVLCHSQDEVALLRRAVPEARVHQVLWSIPAQPVATPFAARQGVAFIGHYGHAPNLDAATWLLDAVMPLVWQTDPAIPCLLAGDGAPDTLRRRAGGPVQVLGHVPDLATVFEAVRLTAAPLRFGAGVKGKVLQSLAAGVPCVMSSVAAEGVAWPAALHATIGQDAAGLAACILHLHADVGANARAALAGLRVMRTLCSEDAVCQSLRAAIEGRATG